MKKLFTTIFFLAASLVLVDAAEIKVTNNQDAEAAHFAVQYCRPVMATI